MYKDRANAVDKQRGRAYFAGLVQPGDRVLVTGEPYWFRDGAQLLPAILAREPQSVAVIDLRCSTLSGLKLTVPDGHKIERLHGDVFLYLRQCGEGRRLFPDCAWVDIFGNLTEEDWQVLVASRDSIRDLFVTFCGESRRHRKGVKWFVPRGVSAEAHIDKLGLPTRLLRSYGKSPMQMCEVHFSGSKFSE